MEEKRPFKFIQNNYEASSKVIEEEDGIAVMCKTMRDEPYNKGPRSVVLITNGMTKLFDYEFVIFVGPLGNDQYTPDQIRNILMSTASFIMPTTDILKERRSNLIIGPDEHLRKFESVNYTLKDEMDIRRTYLPDYLEYRGDFNLPLVFLEPIAYYQ